MAAAFDIRLFEGVFDEKTLKKGFLLFDKNKLSSGKKIGSEYHFEFETGAEVKFTKRGTKISAYACSCGKTHCEHLCAALFYLEPDKWKTEEINKVHKKGSLKISDVFDKLCSGLKAEIKKQFRHRGDEFDLIKNFQMLYPGISTTVFNLVLISEFSLLLPASESDRNVLTQALNELQHAKLSSIEQEYWKRVTRKILLTGFKSRLTIFDFLFPKAVVNSNAAEMTEFKKLLEKVKLKKVYKHHIHPVQVAKYMLLVKENGFKSNISLVENPTEFSIALAKLYLASGKTQQAVECLRKDYAFIKANKPANFIAYLEELITLCEKYKKPEAEFFFIRELIIHDTMVHQKHLVRLDIIVRPSKRKKMIDALLTDVKRSQPEFYFDKLVQLLESDNRLDELIREISRRSDKFFIMNRIAIKKLPDFDEFTLNAYAQQLAAILYEARETYHQKQLFEKAKVYFDGLPKTVSKKLAMKILEKIGKNNFVHGELKKYAEEN